MIVTTTLSHCQYARSALDFTHAMTFFAAWLHHQYQRGLVEEQGARG
jgi:hypothetical protein